MEDKDIDYMNVIPLIDVMLVLLTIVLTTSTFIASGVMPVELPKASKKDEAALRQQVIVEINRDGEIYLNSLPVSLSHLPEVLPSFNKDTPVLIRADKNVALQVFVSVMDFLKSSGFKRISLQTEDKR